MEIDPFAVFSTFHMDHGQLAKTFESDRLKTKKDYGSAKSRNFIDVCMVGASLCPPPPHHHTNVCKISRLSESLLVSDVSLSNSASALSSSADKFSLIGCCQRLKKLWKGLFPKVGRAVKL